MDYLDVPRDHARGSFLAFDDFDLSSLRLSLCISARRYTSGGKCTASAVTDVSFLRPFPMQRDLVFKLLRNCTLV